MTEYFLLPLFLRRHFKLPRALKKVGRFIYYFFIILAFSFCTGIGSAIIGAILGLIIGTVINLIFAVFVVVFSAHDVKLSDQILIIFVQIGFAIGSISGVYFGGNTINQWFQGKDLEIFGSFYLFRHLVSTIKYRESAQHVLTCCPELIRSVLYACKHSYNLYCRM